MHTDDPQDGNIHPQETPKVPTPTPEPSPEGLNPEAIEEVVETPTAFSRWQGTSNSMSKVEEAVAKVKTELHRVVIGQEEMMDLLMAALLTEGHVLIEGVPGIAKTLTAKLMAQSLAVDFNRIQFTPDLMPTDVVGTNVFNLKTSAFSFHQGPIFSNIVLIDEVNRAPAKTQAALFEVDRKSVV